MDNEQNSCVTNSHADENRRKTLNRSTIPLCLFICLSPVLKTHLAGKLYTLQIRKPVLGSAPSFWQSPYEQIGVSHTLPRESNFICHYGSSYLNPELNY